MTKHGFLKIMCKDVLIEDDVLLCDVEVNLHNDSIKQRMCVPVLFVVSFINVIVCTYFHLYFMEITVYCI